MNATPPPELPPDPSSDGLRELSRSRRARLGALAVMLSTVTILGTLVPWVFYPRDSFLVSKSWLVSCAEAGVFLDALLAFIVWGTRWSDVRVFRLAFAYEILRAFTLSWSPLPTHGPPVLTWVTVLVVIFPVLTPYVPRVTLTVTFIAAAMQPLGLFIASNLEPAPVGLPDLVRSAGTALFATVFGLLVAEALRRYTRDLPDQLGSYDLVARIGRGGMGEVWRAQHRFLARPAAVKLIPRREDEKSQKNAEKILRRFRREAQVTANLTSPHTIQVFDYGITQRGVYYYVMEHLDGFDLQLLVSHYGPVPPGRAVYFLRQICDSIGEAHQAGLIHRDLKPGNLFVVRRGLTADFVKVLDFGLVGLGEPLRSPTFDGKITAAGMMTGTPAYISPEMVIGAEVDSRADLYSLGCVLFFLVTGRLVFPGLAPLQMALAHAHEPPPRVSEIARQPIPEDFERIVLLLLEKDPARRPQSAEQLARMLERLSATVPWTEQDSEAWWRENKPSGPSSSMRVAVRLEEQPQPEP